jgi:hypothetical protein
MQVITLTKHQLNVCIEALKMVENTVQNDSTFGSVLDDLLLKTGE